MTSAVDWKLAATVARRVAGDDGDPHSAERRQMAADFSEFVPLAQRLVEAETGWPSLAGAAKAEVVGRAGWIDANLRSFKRLLHPMLSRLEDKLVGPAGWITPKVAAVEIGVVLGWMSGRVLGQYDLLVLEDDDEAAAGHDLTGQDTVYFVGPNLASLEKKFNFEPRDFRLWVALHELTHRAQFTGVPFLRPHFLSLVETMLADTDPDPTRFFVALGRMAESIRQGKGPFADGVGALFATDAQKRVMDQLGGMMSLLEGHGDVVMDRAGLEYVTGAERFGSVLRTRRQQTGAAKVLTQLMGMEAKMRQYEEGERFIEEIEAARGRTALDLAFASVESLPSMDEIRAPQAWLARVSAQA